MAVASQQTSPHSHLKAQSSSGLCPPICSNDGGFINQEFLGWMKPSNPYEPLAELRRRFQNDGYLFVKGLLPKEDVLNVREA